MNLNKTEWKILITAVPHGLTLQAAVKFLGLNYGISRYWLKRYGYQYADGRAVWTPERKRKARWFDHDEIDWSKKNTQIARQFKVSRERIRQLRNNQKTKNHRNKP
jgi:hypothetical protein